MHESKLMCDIYPTRATLI